MSEQCSVLVRHFNSPLFTTYFIHYFCVIDQMAILSLNRFFQALVLWNEHVKYAFG